MKRQHYSFLNPFFNEMNAQFANKWCVLHSYETLPYYSESDVDMALDSSNISFLESIIKRVAKNSGWTLYQKLWYDIPQCFYYVLKNDVDNSYLAIDFIIDSTGIGRYGFDTSILTKDCLIYNHLFPIPNHAVAFTYKLVKRIVKKRSMLNEKDYLINHMKNADTDEIVKILEWQFGKTGQQIVTRQVLAENFSFTQQQIKILNQKKSRKILFSFKIFYQFFWQLIRVINRVFSPKGLILNVPILTDEELKQFHTLLSERVDLLFRYVKINKSQSLKINFSGLVGSTLIVNSKADFKKNKAIQAHWIKPSYFTVDIDAFGNLESMADLYYNVILSILAQRKN